MSRRSTGLVLLNLAGVLVIIGALYDLLVPSIPPNHLEYLGAADGQLDPRYAALDLAMLRSIGGCLLAVGVTALMLTNGPIRQGETWARLTVDGSRFGWCGRREQCLSDVSVRLPLVWSTRVRNTRHHRGGISG